MKTQLLFWSLTILMAFPIFSQTQFSKGTLRIKYNPYLTKESVPTDDYSIQTRVITQALYGLGGEWFLNYYISLNTHLLYRFHDRTIVDANNGPISLPIENRTIRTSNHLTELALSARFYQQDHRSVIRMYAEAGIGNMINIKNSFSKPLHLVPEIASEVTTHYMQYGYLALLIGGGTQFRFSKRWGGDFQLLGRLPLVSKFGRNVQYGVQLGLIYFSK